MTDDNIEQPVTDAVEQSTEQVTEKMLPVSRVNELVKKAKFDGAKKMQDELEALRQENEQLRKSTSMGGMTRAPEMDFEKLRATIKDDLRGDLEAERLEKEDKQLQEEARRLGYEYKSKLAAGKDRYADFDEVMQDFNHGAHPDLVWLANGMDNTADIMYDIAKNPQKLATLSVLLDKDPKAAQSMVSRLSASIKANQNAKSQEQHVNDPLSRLQSSPTGQDTQGGQEIADFKRMFKG